MHEIPKPDATEAKADAKARGWRTAVQGLISTVLVALAAVTLDVVTPGEMIEWAAYGMAALTGALTAVASWVQRRLGR